MTESQTITAVLNTILVRIEKDLRAARIRRGIKLARERKNKNG